MDEQSNVPQADEQPIANEPQDETLTTQPEETEAAEEIRDAEQAETTPEAPLEESTDTTVEDVPEEDEDDSYSPFQSPFQQAQYEPLDINQIPQNEDGTLDAQQLAQAVNDRLAAANQAAQQAQQFALEMEEKRREEQLWQKARDKYPELKSDKQLAAEVNALRFGLLMSEVNTGKDDAKLLSPAQAYERLNKRFSNFKAEGVKQATESVKVQDSVYVEPSNAGASSAKSSSDQLFSKMRSPDRREAESAASEMLDRILFGGE